MKKLLLSIILISCFLQFGYSQKKQAWVQAADQAFTVEADYYKAFKYYETALLYTRDTSDRLRLFYRKAESARLINAYLDARDAYLEVVKRVPQEELGQSPYRCAWAYLGDLQLSLAYSGNDALKTEYYNQAATYFNTYKNGAPSGDCDETADKGLAIIEFATKDNGLQLTNDSVEVINVGPNINSRFSDFAAMPWGDRLYFTSYRNEIRQKGVKPQRYFSRIYLSTNGSLADTLPTINLTPDDTLHVGHTTFNRDRSRIYFTLCEFENGTLSTRCDLYYHQLNANGLPIGDAIAVTELNMEAATITQPALTWDEAEQREILYFVSNRSGGRGGMDIWKSELVDGQFRLPTNDMVINTTGDEMTPFAHNGMFYFSSNGQPNRYGGFDIFATPNPITAEPINLGQKINSSADELYYTRNEEGDKAYFSSNRLATTTYELEEGKPDRLKEACCLDIYAYDIKEPPCILEVSTFSHCNCAGDDTQQILTGVSLKLYDITDGGDISGKQGIDPYSPVENVYQFIGALYPNRKYLLVGTADGLAEQRKELDFTYGNPPCTDGPETAELCFECDTPSLAVQVYDDNGQEIPEASVRIVDVTNLPAYQAGKNPTNATQMTPYNRGSSNQVIPCADEINFYEPISGEEEIGAFTTHKIEFDRTYLIVANSGRDSLLLGTTTYLAARTDEAFCGLSCEDMVRIDLAPLPKTELFFENARPRWQGWRNSRRTQDIAAQSYIQSLRTYAPRAEDYAAQFSSDSERDFEQRSELNQFFTNLVIPSDTNLHNLAREVTALLCQKIPITIEANGCTSPKFKVQTDVKQVSFNDHLGNRRVESVEQDLKSFGLTEEKYPGLYKFQQVSKPCKPRPKSSTPIPIEELQDQRNKKLSVFSVDAAEARRVELVVKIQK